MGKLLIVCLFIGIFHATFSKLSISESEDLWVENEVNKLIGDYMSQDFKDTPTPHLVVDDDDEDELMADYDSMSSYVQYDATDCSFTDRSGCQTMSIAAGSDKMVKHVFQNTIISALSDASKKREVCFKCGALHNWTDQDCNDRFWHDAKRSCMCKYATGTEDRKHCLEAAASVYSSTSFFHERTLLANVPSACSKDCALYSSPKIPL